MSDWNTQVADEVRRAVPAATAAQALRSHHTDYGASIAIRTPRYQIWLKKTDPHRKKPITASIAEFFQRRQGFHLIIAELLDQVGLYELGKALFHELDATPNRVTIWPYALYHDDVNATAGPTDWPAATRPGVPLEGDPQKRVGTGGGSDAVVHISPNQWDRAGAGGPASRPDEVLFHELVHASRQMRGVAYGMPVSAGYDNEEEYISVVLTNIYLSQKRQTVFRASHHGHKPLPQPERFLSNIQNVSLSPELLIERFRHTTLPFYYRIMSIPDQSVWFNPVREYERARFAALSGSP